ncbi:uncharacterized protein LOC123273907 [Cotesia glomerata]|uniref:uncharacterized protein LOC123273907 n=1 Tax=Cotesia glomerata TaxID=32391 RepID=UPI001D003830|nr:uncharacterized protein LOC123273907 [Cotesia glomerata]
MYFIIPTGSLKSLEKQLALLEGLVSPLRPERTLEEIRKNFKSSVKRTLEDDFNDFGAEQSRISELSEKRKKKKNFTAGEQDEIQNQPRDNGENSDAIEDPETHEIEEEPPIAHEDFISNEQIHQDNQSIKQVLKDLVSEIRTIKESQTQILQRQLGNQNLQPELNAQVEIGHPGSNVFVRRNQWDTADSRDTFQSMGVSLVKALYEEDVLLRSNLKGGASKIDKNAPQRPGLDKNILAAIKEAVKQKFPAEFKQSLFGMAINNMMTDMRKKTQAAADIQNQEGAN